MADKYAAKPPALQIDAADSPAPSPQPRRRLSMDLLASPFKPKRSAKVAAGAGSADSPTSAAAALADQMVQRLGLGHVTPLPTPASERDPQSRRRSSVTGVSARRRSSVTAAAGRAVDALRGMATPGRPGGGRRLSQGSGREQRHESGPVRRSSLRPRHAMRSSIRVSALGPPEQVAAWLRAVVPLESGGARPFRQARDCFAGQAAADWLLRLDDVPSRARADALLQRLVEARYVTPQQQDSAGLYRFALPAGATGGAAQTELPDGLSSAEVSRVAAFLRDHVSVRDHVHHLRTFRACATARELVDWTIVGGFMRTRAHARHLCQLLLDGDALLPVFGGDRRTFKDDDAGYRLNAELLADLGAPVAVAKELPAETALQAVVEQLRDVVPVRTHKIRFKQFPRSFWGHEAVDWLLQTSYATSRAEAAALGQRMLAAKHLRHVAEDGRGFEDGAQLYRFYLDEDEAGQHDIADPDERQDPDADQQQQQAQQPQPEEKPRLRHVRDDVHDLSKLVAKRAEGDEGEDERLVRLAAYVPARIVRHYAASQEPACAPVENNRPKPLVERFDAAVLFADISGFSVLAEKLLRDRLGNVGYAGEELSDYVGKSLAKMIAAIVESGGDVIKFAGDAVFAVYPTALFGGSLANAAYSATRCALRLIELPLQAGDTTLSVHCGIGAGTVIGLHVGGRYQRWEYVICGPPLTQVASAEKDAEAGEVVVSPEVDALISAPGARALESGNFFVERLSGMAATPRPDGPSLVHTVQGFSGAVGDSVRSAISHYVPRPVVLGIEAGSGVVAAELRVATIVFIKVLGLAVDGDSVDVDRVQDVVLLVQDCIYKFEGTFCRFIIDDKGAGMLWAFGLPPLSHPNDAVLAVRAALETHERVSRVPLPSADSPPAPAAAAAALPPAMNIRLSSTSMASHSDSDSSDSSDDEGTEGVAEIKEEEEGEEEDLSSAMRHVDARRTPPPVNRRAHNTIAVSSPNTQRRVSNRWRTAFERIVRGSPVDKPRTLQAGDEGSDGSSGSSPDTGPRRQSAFVRASSFVAGGGGGGGGGQPGLERRLSAMRMPTFRRESSVEDLTLKVARKWSTFRRDAATEAVADAEAKARAKAEAEAAAAAAAKPTHMRAAIGITTGRVFLGGVGGDQRAEYTLHGTVVNLSARLMVAAKDGVLCDEAVWESAKDTFVFEKPRQIRVKNIADLVTVYRPTTIRQQQRSTILRQSTPSLVRSGSEASVGGGANSGDDAGGADRERPIVGREREVGQLMRAVERLVDRGCAGSVVVLQGETGVGKKALMRQLVTRAQRRGAYVVQSYGMDIERSTPFFAWRQLLVGLLGEGILSAANAREHAERALPRHLVAQIHMLFDVLPELRTAADGEAKDEEQASRVGSAKRVPDAARAHAEDVGNLIVNIVKHRAQAAVSDVAQQWRERLRGAAAAADALADSDTSPGSASAAEQRPSLLRRLSKAALLGPDSSPPRSRTASSTSPAAVSEALSGAQSGEDAAEVRRRLGPLLFVVEDAQWLDSLSWDLLCRVAAAVPHMLVIVTQEPSISPSAAQRELMSLAKSELVELGPLSHEGVGALVAQQLAVPRAPAQLVDTVFEKAQGHPLFTEELVKLIAASGVLHVDSRTRECQLRTESLGGDAWASRLALPASVSHMITTRIDSLMPSPAMTLQVASILGFVFRTDMLLRCYPTPIVWAALAEDLSVLVEYGFIKREGASLSAVEYKFKSSVIKDAAAELLLYSTRRAVHLKVATYLARRPGATSASVGAMAQHYLAAEEYGLAQSHFERAARVALDGQNWHEVVAALSKLLHLHPRLRAGASNVRQARWMRQLASAYVAMGEPAKAERYLVQALRRAGVPCARPGFWRSRRAAWRMRGGRLPPGAAALPAEQLLEACRSYQLLGDVSGAHASVALLTALRLAEHTKSSEELARVHARLAVDTLRAGAHSTRSLVAADNHIDVAIRNWAAVEMQRSMSAASTRSLSAKEEEDGAGGDEDVEQRAHDTKLYVYRHAAEYAAAVGRWEDAVAKAQREQWMCEFLQMHSRELLAAQLQAMVARCQGRGNEMRYLVGLPAVRGGAGNSHSRRRRSSVSRSMMLHASASLAVAQAHVLAMLGEWGAADRKLRSACGVGEEGPLEDARAMLDALPPTPEALHALAAVLQFHGGLGAAELDLLGARLAAAAAGDRGRRVSAVHAFLHVALVVVAERKTARRTPGLGALGAVALQALRGYADWYPSCRVAYALAEAALADNVRLLRAVAARALAEGHLMDHALALKLMGAPEWEERWAEAVCR